MEKFHLKGIDTYRGIAALVVLMAHIELFKDRFGHSNLLAFPFYEHTGGHISVVLFFVLSGFLITLLLLNEKAKFQKISLKNFYLRRIFRVWPLYYLIIIISYLLIDYSPSATTIVLCLTIFPNIAQALGQGWAISPQIWSIGVEEQFYLAWPFIVKKSKNVFLIILLLFIGFTLLPHGILFILNRVYPDPEIMLLVNKIFIGTKFNCMAMGAFVAVLYHKKMLIIELLNRYLTVSYLIIILPFFLWGLGFHILYFTDELYSILFAFSILIITSNQKIIGMDSPVSSFIGKISYGIYMYHWIILELLFKTRLASVESNVNFNVLLYVLAIGLTGLMATLSYYYIELPFLNLKLKYNRQ